MPSELLIARALTWRYIVALTLVAMLTTAAWLSLHLVISEQKSTAAVVNISGRQRMLSQRTALFSSLLLHTPRQQRQEVRSRLREAAALMQRSHLGLIRGDRDLGLPGEMSRTVHAMYFDGPDALDSQVRAYLAAVQALLQTRDEDLTLDNPQLRYIMTRAPGPLVAALDKMVRQYQAEGERAIRRLESAETVVWLVTLLLLVMEAAFIFQPFARHLRNVVGKLQATTEELREHREMLEEQVRQRTRDLQKKTEELAESEERFRSISTSAKDAILIIDQREAIVYWNPAASAMFGYAEDETLGRNMHDLLAAPRYRDEIRRGFAQFCASGSGPMIGRTVEVTALRKNGEEFPIELSISIVQLHGCMHALGMVRDITARKRMETELREMATTDSLTGLPNRRHFLARMEESLAQLQRQVMQSAIVLMLDLDHFKRINDGYGHAAGDAVLRHVTRLMRDSLRKNDMAGRLGGEEFALILPGADAAGARAFAERLRQRVADTPVVHEGRPIVATISIGIAALEPGDASAGAAISRADAALYRAKGNGRNRVEQEAGMFNVA
ncbi:diguanylate cyclase [Noviherbaspirillum autotrophicum]|uniref:diguanylate cyclase n=1 Tax=Noviherbaspirillum autotrophicum TaxID=709839 RepID=UPI0006936343|nr:diguanylate cyclase [Noviherbaspirillum autotrophicum]